MFMKKYGDIIVAVFFILLSAAMIAMALQFPKSAIMEIGPDFMPIVVSSCTLVLGFVLLYLSLRKLRRADAAEQDVKDESDYKRVSVSFALILVYVFTMKPIGFIISTILYLPLQMLVLAPEDKRKKKDVITVSAVSIIFTLVVFLLFRYGFKIVLPSGLFTIQF